MQERVYLRIPPLPGISIIGSLLNSQCRLRTCLMCQEKNISDRAILLIRLCYRVNRSYATADTFRR